MSWLYACMYTMHVCGAWRGYKSASDGTGHRWVLATEPGSSAETASAPNHWGISLTPKLFFIYFKQAITFRKVTKVLFSFKG